MTQMRIVVDAMGSDSYPAPDVEGAVLAAREWNDTIILVGKEDLIRAELGKHDTAGLSIEVVHAGEVIEMTDKPSDVVRGKPDSSMHVGMSLVRNGDADAYVTAGNTGGVLAVSTLGPLRRMKGVQRPALTAIFPNLTGMVMAADIGANADCKPEYLLQFAFMTSIFAKQAMGIENPRVVLLSNGEEEGKGNELVKETIPLMRKQSAVNYIGNMEPKEVLAGETDIVIHDGFTGNVFIKSIESTASMVSKLIKKEITAGAITSIGGLLAKPAFGRVAKHTDPFEVGGAPLLGLNGIVIVAHGRSNGMAIRNAVRQARRAVAGGVIEAIREAISTL
jgi:glycerol-3-phosphate acyltransferase PlsX